MIVELSSYDAVAGYERWARSFDWHMRQIPVLIGHLRDLMNPLAASTTDKVVVSGSSDPRKLPFRLGSLDVDEATPMEEADRLWSELVWYGSTVSQHLGVQTPSPHALRAAWTNEHGDVLLPAPGGHGWRPLSRRTRSPHGSPITGRRSTRSPCGTWKRTCSRPSGTSSSDTG